MALPLWLATTVTGIACTFATARVNASLYTRLPDAPVACAAVVLFIAGLVTVFICTKREQYLAAFIGSCCFLSGILGATAGCLFPVMLKSSLRPEWSLTAYNASSGDHDLRLGLRWWILGLPLVIAYFVFLFYIHGKKRLEKTTAGSS